MATKQIESVEGPQLRDDQIVTDGIVATMEPDDIRLLKLSAKVKEQPLEAGFLSPGDFAVICEHAGQDTWTKILSLVTPEVRELLYAHDELMAAANGKMAVREYQSAIDAIKLIWGKPTEAGE